MSLSFSGEASPNFASERIQQRFPGELDVRDDEPASQSDVLE